jgi:hypothetical protein
MGISQGKLLVLEVLPGEMVNKVLPSLHSPILQDPRELASTKQFVSLCQLYGQPVTILDRCDGL